MLSVIKYANRRIREHTRNGLCQSLFCSIIRSMFINIILRKNFEKFEYNEPKLAQNIEALFFYHLKKLIKY